MLSIFLSLFIVIFENSKCISCFLCWLILIPKNTSLNLCIISFIISNGIGSPYTSWRSCFSSCSLYFNLPISSFIAFTLVDSSLLSSITSSKSSMFLLLLSVSFYISLLICSNCSNVGFNLVYLYLFLFMLSITLLSFLSNIY